MIVSRVASRLYTSILARSRSSLLLSVRRKQPYVPVSDQFHSLCDPQKVVPVDVLLINKTSILFQRFGFSSSASPQTDHGKEMSEFVDGLSKDDLVKLVYEKEELLKTKDTKLEMMKAKALLKFSNKYPILSFVADVADHLGSVFFWVHYV